MPPKKPEKTQKPEYPNLEEGLTPAQMKEMKAIFNLFDADQSGTIDPKEVRTQMKALGFEADNTTIYQLISDLDSDGSQKLEFEEFGGLLKDTLKLHSTSYATRDAMREIYDYMDDLVPQNRDHKIDSSNLKRIASVLGDPITDAEIEVMIQCADRDGKGYVSAEDFYELMSGEAKKFESEVLDEDLESTSVGPLPEEREPTAKKKVRGIQISDNVERIDTEAFGYAPTSALATKAAKVETVKTKPRRAVFMVEEEKASEAEDEPSKSSKVEKVENVKPKTRRAVFMVDEEEASKAEGEPSKS